MKQLRLVKALLVAQVGLFALLVAFNNITDYSSNFNFVQHVLMMDTTFEGNSLMWRSISSPILHHFFYWVIIAAEAAAGVLCLVGAWKLYLSSRHGFDNYYAARQMATWGLFVGISLWFTGFMTVGAEWFVMWQSEIWNGQSAAFRFIVIIFSVLIFLHLPEESES